MPRLLAAVLLAFLPIFAAAQNTNPVSWYRQLTGSIGKNPVTMLLHKAGHLYKGYYYDESQQRPIYFRGDDTTYKDSVSLMAFGGIVQDESFVFAFDGEHAAGTWKSSGNKNSKKTFEFTATADTAATFQYVFTEGSAKLRPSHRNSPTGTYQSAAVWPVGKTPKDNLIKSVIRQIFDSTHHGSADIGAILLKDKKETLDGYRKDNLDASDSDLALMPASFSMDIENDVLICYTSPNILSLVHQYYAFTGGAHGNYGSAYMVLDLKARKRLQLHDIISEEGKKALGKLLEKNFRLQQHLRPNHSLQDAGLFSNTIEPTDNFYLTGKGIGFSYDPYEIGPYSSGQIDIFVPFTDLKGYLIKRQ